MICKNCGALCTPEAAFCANCGTPVEKENPPLQMQSREAEYTQTSLAAEPETAAPWKEAAPPQSTEEEATQALCPEEETVLLAAEKTAIGYDPETGEPIYETIEESAAPREPVIVGYDPETGEPIYETKEEIAAPREPVIVGYDPETGEPIYETIEESAASREPVIVGYDPETGAPIYGVAEEPQQKKRKLWIPFVIGGGVLCLLLAALIGIFLLRGNSCETVAEDFIEAVFMSDREALSELMQPNVYAYLGDQLDLGVTAERCSTEAVDVEEMSQEELTEYNWLLEILEAEEPMEKGCYVTVDYTVEYYGEQSGEIVVVTGYVDNQWYVISLGG